jgi:LysM repeat protein
LFTEKIGKRISPAPRAALVLCAALTMWALVLAVSPATAQAQTSAKAQATEAANAAAQGARGAAGAASSVVVEPGDSLWSISEERLGPDATPRRVMKGAARIHELNRARIGADPGLIVVGQVLSMPRAMSEPPARASAPAGEAAEASGSDPRDRAAKGPAVKEAPSKAPGQGAVPRSGITLEEAAEMLGADVVAGQQALPEPPAAAPVPAARTVASQDARPPSVAPLLRAAHAELASAASALTEPFFGEAPDARTEGRRLLGLGLMALSLLVPLAVALAAAHGRGAPRREARKREPGPQGPHGGPYPGPAPSANHLDRLDLLAVARAKRERVRRGRTPGVRRRRHLARQRPPGRSRHRRSRRR